MRKFIAQLRPLERRLAVGVLVVLFLVLNFVFVWPHFSDWSRLRIRLDAARREVNRDQAAIGSEGLGADASRAGFHATGGELGHVTLGGFHKKMLAEIANHFG